MSDSTLLPSRLRDARTLAGLTQKQAAAILGVHRPTISQIESGQRRVSTEELQRFAKAYDVSASWLLGEGTDDAYTDQVQVAARALGKLDQEDLDRLMTVLSSLRKR